MADGEGQVAGHERLTLGASPGSGGAANPQGSGANPQSSGEGSGAGAQSGEELVPISRVRDLQGTNDRLRNELEQLKGQVTSFQGEAETARAAAGDVQKESLGNLRRALLAENRGQVVEELVAGDTAEAITASVEAARGAFNRATEAAKAQLQRQQVPAGAPTRDAAANVDVEALSPTSKIARGLEQRSSS